MKRRGRRRWRWRRMRSWSRWSKLLEYNSNKLQDADVYKWSIKKMMNFEALFLEKLHFALIFGSHSQDQI